MFVGCMDVTIAHLCEKCRLHVYIDSSVQRVFSRQLQSRFLSQQVALLKSIKNMFLYHIILFKE